MVSFSVAENEAETTMLETATTTGSAERTELPIVGQEEQQSSASRTVFPILGCLIAVLLL